MSRNNTVWQNKEQWYVSCLYILSIKYPKLQTYAICQFCIIYPLQHKESGWVDVQYIISNNKISCIDMLSNFLYSYYRVTLYIGNGFSWYFFLISSAVPQFSESHFCMSLSVKIFFIFTLTASTIHKRHHLLHHFHQFHFLLCYKVYIHYLCVYT